METMYLNPLMESYRTRIEDHPFPDVQPIHASAIDRQMLFSQPAMKDVVLTFQSRQADNRSSRSRIVKQHLHNAAGVRLGDILDVVDKLRRLARGQSVYVIFDTAEYKVLEDNEVLSRLARQIRDRKRNEASMSA